MLSPVFLLGLVPFANAVPLQLTQQGRLMDATGAAEVVDAPDRGPRYQGHHRSGAQKSKSREFPASLLP